MAHSKPSRPNSGLGFQVNVVKPFEIVPSLLGSGLAMEAHMACDGSKSGLLEPNVEVGRVWAWLWRVKHYRFRFGGGCKAVYGGVQAPYVDPRFALGTIY